MFDNATEKTLRLIAAGMYLKQFHGLDFALCMLIDAGFRECVARAALEDRQVLLSASFKVKYCQNDDIHPE